MEAIKTWHNVASRPMSEATKHAAKISSAITIGQFLVAKGARTEERFRPLFKEAVGSDSPEYARTGFALGMFNLDLLDEAEWAGEPVDITEELAKLKRVQIAAYGPKTESDLLAELATLEAELEEKDKEYEKALEIARLRGRAQAWKEATAELKASQVGENATSQVGGTILAFLLIAALIVIAIKLLAN